LVVGLVAAVGAVVLGLRGMGERSGPCFRRVYALCALVPVFVTRYAWPVHYVVAAPFLAECLAPPRATGRRAAAVVFAAATALFYAGHAEALRFLPEHGVLVLGTALAMLCFRESREGPTLAYAEQAAVLGRFPRRPLLPGVHRSVRLSRSRYAEVVERLPARGVLVDLASGEGLLSHLWVGRAPDRRAVAVDHDAGRVARLRASASGLPIEVTQGSMESFPIPPCDAVAIVDALHYLDGPAQDALLPRAFEALRPGGVLVIRDPDAGAGLPFLWNRVHERLATALGFTKARIGRYRSAAEWGGALRAAGFATAEALPRPCFSAYADRVLVATKAVAP
jgi:SAM-dependent methyltransferase